MLAMLRTIRGFVAHFTFHLMRLDPRGRVADWLLPWAGDWIYRRERNRGRA